jgi:hypothetical protein
MTIEKRQPARFINIWRRFQALTSQERVLATKLQKLILVTIFRARTVESDEEREKSSALAHLALRKYCTILYFEDDGIPRPIRLDRTIASFSASQCWNFFETRQDDLIRLLRALKLPEICRLRNGSTMAGEEVMLRGLYELVTGENQFNIAENIFGRKQTQQSRAFYFFVEHVFTTFYDLVTDNLQWWWDNGLCTNLRTLSPDAFAHLVGRGATLWGGSSTATAWRRQGSLVVHDVEEPTQDDGSATYRRPSTMDGRVSTGSSTKLWRPHFTASQ